MAVINIPFNTSQTYKSLKLSAFKVSQVPGENVTSFNIDSKILDILDFIKISLGVELKINSSGRTVKHNALQSGSSPNSYHLIKNERPVFACDSRPIDLDQLPRYKKFIIDNIKELQNIGLKNIGFYPTFVHLDTGGKSFYTWGLSSKEFNQLQKNQQKINLVQTIKDTIL